MTEKNNVQDVKNTIEATMTETTIEAKTKERGGFFSGIKTFVKEHKKAIIIGGAALLGGVIAYAVKSHANDDEDEMVYLPQEQPTYQLETGEGTATYVEDTERE